MGDLLNKRTTCYPAPIFFDAETGSKLTDCRFACQLRQFSGFAGGVRATAASDVSSRNVKVS